MDFDGDEDHYSFADEDRRSIVLPPRLSCDVHERVSDHGLHFAYARSSSVSATAFPASPLSPRSPKTPWLRSPLHMSTPSSHLFYHCLASLHRQKGNIYSITISKDFIFTGSESSRIHAWKKPDVNEIGHIKTKCAQVYNVLACGKMLFSTHGDCKIRVWDVSIVEYCRAKKIATLPQRNPFLILQRKSRAQHKGLISCLAYNQADKLLYTGSSDKTVKAWNIGKLQCVDSFLAHDGQVNAIIVNQEDGSVFTCSSDGSVKIWRRVFGESYHILVMTLRFQPSPVNALAMSLSSTSTFLYSGSSDGLINFWEKEKISGRYNHGGFLQGHHFAVLCLESTENLVFSGSENATIRVWRREEENCFHACILVIEGHHGPIRCLAISMEITNELKSLLVYSASLDRTLKVWQVNLESSMKNYTRDILEGEINPVLSPSWVEKKLQSNQIP